MPAGSSFTPFNFPIVYDPGVVGVAHPDRVTIDLSVNVLARAIPWAHGMPIAGPGIGAGALIGGIAADGRSLTIGSALTSRYGVNLPLSVCVTPQIWWDLPAGCDANSEFWLEVQSPGGGGAIKVGPAGSGGKLVTGLKNFQPGARLLLYPGMPGTGSENFDDGACDGTMTQAWIYDSLTPGGDLVASPGGGRAATLATCGIGLGGDSELPADPYASPHIVQSSYYPYDGHDSGRLDADGFGNGASGYNAPTGGMVPGGGGGVVGAKWPTGARGMGGGMAQAFIRQLR